MFERTFLSKKPIICEALWTALKHTVIYSYFTHDSLNHLKD